MNSGKLLLFVLQTSIFLLDCNALDGEGIVGGDQALFEHYPYQVSIQKDGVNICGGGLISEHHVITAAHCVADNKGIFFNEPLYAVGGTNDLMSTTSTRLESFIEKIYIPAKYGKYYDKYGLYDIAVLRLFEALDFGPGSFLELPRRAESFEDEHGIVTGFGWTEIKLKETEDESLYLGQSRSLRSAKVNILSNDECTARKKKSIYPVQVCGQVVQRDPNNPGGICYGDSGSPLVLGNIIVGVVNSSPKDCNEKDEPAVYARVSTQLNFITSCIKDEIDESIKAIAVLPFLSLQNDHLNSYAYSYST